MQADTILHCDELEVAFFVDGFEMPMCSQVAAKNAELNLDLENRMRHEVESLGLADIQKAQPTLSLLVVPIFHKVILPVGTCIVLPNKADRILLYRWQYLAEMSMLFGMLAIILTTMSEVTDTH